METIPGLGRLDGLLNNGFEERMTGGHGIWRTGRDGVRHILTPADGIAEFIAFQDKTLVYVRSAMGYPAIYPLQESGFDAPARWVLMDLDGTSIRSEGFWIGIIGLRVRRFCVPTSGD